MPEYGSDEYFAKLHELEDRGFFDSYIPLGLRPWGYGQDEDDDEWEDEEYERG